MTEIINDISENIQQAKQMASPGVESEGFFDQALEDVESSKFLPVQDYKVVKALQNVTDDVSQAKHEIDKQGSMAVSQLLQQVLDDVAVAKYLGDLEGMNG